MGLRVHDEVSKSTSNSPLTLTVIAIFDQCPLLSSCTGHSTIKTYELKHHSCELNVKQLAREAKLDWVSTEYRVRPGLLESVHINYSY